MSFTDDIIAFENGDLSDLQTLELFSHLIKTGQAWSLQGLYGRSANHLIGAGFITPEGVITQAAYDRLAEVSEEPTDPEPEVDPHNDWGISQQRIEEHFARAAQGSEKAGPRNYVVGIPLAVTVNPDGTIVLDFDLSEVTDFTEHVEGDITPEIEADVDLVSKRLHRLRNQHRLTLPVPALKEVS